MDALTSMLDHLHSSGTLVGTNVLTPPWAIRFGDAAPLSIVSMLRGGAWIVPADDARSDPVRLDNGALALITGRRQFTVTSDPDASLEPLYVLEDPTLCTDATARVLAPGELTLGTRSCGARLDGEHALFTSTYTTTSTAASRIVSSLPGIVLIPAEDRPAPMQLVEGEIAKDQPGQQAVLDRLLDLLLVAVLRDWFARETERAPAWYRAASDPIIGPALRAIHDQPADPWTVESLAREASVSRAAFARRFTSLVRETPIAYLTGWRLSLASDLLSTTDATVESVAHSVGYANAFALSAAFTRRFGHRPTQHRRGQAAAVPPAGLEPALDRV